MNSKFWRKLLMLFLLGIVCSKELQTEAQEQTGTVQGFIRSTSGPSSSTKVIVTSDVIGSYEGVVFTDERGFFSLSGVPVGGKVNVYVLNKEARVVGKGTGLLSHQGETVVVNIEQVLL